MKELELSSKSMLAVSFDPSKVFDVTKHIRLVPQFQEKEVDKYLLHSEKVAENLKWPKEHWALLLQSVVIGKAREIYTQLPLDQSSDYDTVKDLILKAYELVPEAYRQKFRNCRKEHDQTHVEFARTKEQVFDRWCSSKDVKSDHAKLRQLMLVEEFKRCIHSDVKFFLDEREVETLVVAARLADDYALTHKTSFVNKPYKKPLTLNLNLIHLNQNHLTLNRELILLNLIHNHKLDYSQLIIPVHHIIPKIKILVKTKVKDPHTHPGCFAIIAKVTVTSFLNVKL